MNPKSISLYVVRPTLTLLDFIEYSMLLWYTICLIGDAVKMKFTMIIL